MESKYVMLECNRLRSLEVQQKGEHGDIHKNKWSNLVSQSGILINKGDTISVQQVIVNTKGATDQVLEFTGDTNNNGFVDNKTRLNYSFYVNNTGRNCVPLPFIDHKCYKGNGATSAPTLTNLDPTQKMPTIKTDNGPDPAVNDVQTMLSRRSLGEFLFAPNSPGAPQGYPQWQGGPSNTIDIFDKVSDPYKNYYNGDYIFRLSVSQTGIGTTATNGYFPGNKYPAMKKKTTNSFVLTNPSGAAGQKVLTCIEDPRVQVGDALQDKAITGPPTKTYGIIASISTDGVNMTITCVGNLTHTLPETAGGADLPVFCNTNPVPPATDPGLTTGIVIKVLTTSGDASDPPNQITAWEVAECDVDKGHLVRAGDTIMLSVNPDGVIDPNFIEPTAWAEYTIHATPDNNGYMSANTNRIDGERYYLMNNFYTGLANQTEETIGQATTHGDLLDFASLQPTMEKRVSSVDLEIEPSFATPDNIGSILTDQLHAPNKLSLDNPKDDFYDFTYNNYDFNQIVPYGPDLALTTKYQDTTQLIPNNKPVIVSTPTYKPCVANMYGFGMPEVVFDPLTNELRQSNQGSYAGMRRRFYNSVAYRDMNRVLALKNAFYNFEYQKPIGQNVEYNRDIYIGLQSTEYANRADVNYGDFGNIRRGELGSRVCMLNHFQATQVGLFNSNLVVLPKHSLILTNMKYNSSNISRLATSFRKCEEYLGDLSQKVDITSDDYKNNLCVNLDLGMYCDEKSTVELQQITGSGLGPDFTFPHHQRNKFANKLEASFTYNNATIVPTDNENDGNPANYFRCQGYQKDFTGNDSQQLSSIWVKSRFQEGFIYENAIDPSFVGDKIENIDGFIQAQRQTTTPYFATQYREYNLDNDLAPGDYRFITITQDDHTTKIPFGADWTFTEYLRNGMEVECTHGTIDGNSIVGKRSRISNVNLQNNTTGVAFTLDTPFGSVAFGGLGGAQNVKIRAITPPESTFFTMRNWTDNGVDTRDLDYAIGLARENNLAVVPIFQPVLDPQQRIGGFQQDPEGDFLDEVPLIAFVSNYELGAQTKGIADFDKVNLGNPNNKWQVDIQSSTQGTQIGFDPSFTRNPAVALTNVQVGNGDPAQVQSYINSCYVGAVNPEIKFNPDLSRFELSGLNTPMVQGNGLPSDIPQNLTANETPEQQCYQVHQKNRIWQSRPKLVGDITGTAAQSNVYNQFNTTQKYQSIMDSQSGIAIESIGLFNNVGVETQIQPGDFASYENTLLSKLGFSLDQLLVPVGREQAFFVNNFVFQDIFTYEKSLNNFVKPLTTGAFISSAEIQPLSLNEMSMPLFDLGMDSVIRSANPDCSQASITAFGLPDKLDYPYLVIYSSIPEGSSNTEFIGGSDSQSLIPAVAYLYRNENNGDFFYGLESDITFTAIKDYVLSQVDIDIRKPDGSKPSLAPHSAVIFKITKPLIVPDPELILKGK